MNKKILLIGLWILLLISFVNGAEFINILSDSYTTVGASATTPYGVKFNLLNESSELIVTKFIITGADRCRIYNSSKDLIGTSSYIGLNASFIQNFSVGTYYVLNDATGVNWAPRYNITDVSYPVDQLTINFTKRIYNEIGSVAEDEIAYHSIKSITTTISDVIPINFTITAYDIEWSSDISNFSANVDSIDYNSNIALKEIITDINDSQIVNITIEADGYFSKTYINWNTSEDLQANLTINYTTLNVSAYDYSASLINDFTAIAESLNSTHTINVSTITGIATLELNWNETYNISIDAENYSLYNNSNTIEMDSYFKELNITGLRELNTINITFYNEDTSEIMNDTTVNFNLIGTLFSNNYSTSNGTSYLTLITPDEYIITYSASGFPERTYYFTLSNRTYNELNLYLSNETTQVTATVYDEIGDFIEGARIEVLKYDLNSNSYIISQQADTNFEGKAILNLVLNSQYYKFRIRYDDQIKLNTDPTYVFQTTIQFQIITGDNVAETFFTVENIDNSLVFNTATNNFRFDYSDSSGLVSQYCLETRKKLLTKINDYNISCLSSSSGTILSPIEEINGTTYYARAYIILDGEERNLNTLIQSFLGNIDSTKTNIIWIFFLILIFAIVGFYAGGLIGALIFHPIPLIFASFIGFISIQPSIGITWEVLMIVMSFIISKNS